MKKFPVLVLLSFSILFFGQKTNELKAEQTIVKYKKLTGDSGVGVLGTQTEKAVAIHIDEILEDSLPQIFHTVKFETFSLNSKKSTIFLCIYENENGLPGKIIDQGKILIEIPSRKTEIIADLSSLKIQVPNKGYFIGFEWILSKKHKINSTSNTSQKPYNPAVSGIVNEDENLFTLDQIWGKSERGLVSTLNLEITYLPKN